MPCNVYNKFYSLTITVDEEGGTLYMKDEIEIKMDVALEHGFYLSL